MLKHRQCINDVLYYFFCLILHSSGEGKEDYGVINLYTLEMCVHHSDSG